MAHPMCRYDGLRQPSIVVCGRYVDHFATRL
jgi:hypothetical protein